MRLPQGFRASLKKLKQVSRILGQRVLLKWFRICHPLDQFAPREEPLPGEYCCRYCNKDLKEIHHAETHVHLTDEDRANLLHFAIVGGGPTGIESQEEDVTPRYTDKRLRVFQKMGQDVQPLFAPAHLDTDPSSIPCPPREDHTAEGMWNARQRNQTCLVASFKP